MNKLPIDLPKNCFDCKAPKIFESFIQQTPGKAIEFECGGSFEINKMYGVYSVKYNSCKKLKR